MYSLVLICRRANWDFHGACLHRGGGLSVTERFPVRDHIIFLTFIINIIILFILFGTSSRATLSSVILTAKTSQMSDVFIADNRLVAWEVELSSTSQVSRRSKLGTDYVSAIIVHIWRSVVPEVGRRHMRSSNNSGVFYVDGDSVKWGKSRKAQNKDSNLRPSDY